MIPQDLDGPTYYAQFLVTAAVQFYESDKNCFIDKKQNRKVQYLGNKEKRDDSNRLHSSRIKTDPSGPILMRKKAAT